MTLAYEPRKSEFGFGRGAGVPSNLAAHRRAPRRVRQDGRNSTVGTPCGRSLVIRFAAVLAVGYVLGAKAGRRRYEQIAGTYKAITESPRTKAVLDAGRRKVADRVSPDPTMVRLTSIDANTSVLQPETGTDGR